MLELDTYEEFDTGIRIYNKDSEIIPLLKDFQLYDYLTQRADEATLFPLVYPFSEKPNEYSLLIFVRYQQKTDLGQWEIFELEDFLLQGTNLAKLLPYLENGTGIEFGQIMQAIQQATKERLIEDNLPTKVSLAVQPEKKIIAFCILDK